MLKLKDIFNIDLNSKGGGKLYKKIMRKYNIPLKDVKEVKQEIVECSSGGGERVKEYYYKVIDEQVCEIIKTFPYILISGIICNKRYEYIYAPHLGTPNFLAFRIVDIEMTYWGYIEHNKIDRGIILKGNLYERISLGITAADNPVSVEDVKNQFGSMLEEITKEEYEAMITYKP